MAGFGEGDRLGGDDMGHRPAEHHRAALVHGIGVLGGGQHQSATRTAQRLMRGGGDDVSMRNRVLVTGEHLAGHQTGEVRHVDHERGAHLIGDLAHRGEVHPPRVRRVPGHQDQRLELPDGSGDGVVVDQPGRRVGAITALVKHLAGDVGAEAVGEMTAGVQRHSHQALAAQLGSQTFPLGLGEVIDVLDADLTQCGRLDPGGQNGPEGDQVRVDAGVRLNVGIGSAEQLAGVLGGDGFDLVDILAAGIETVPDGAFGVFVRQPGAHGQQNRR